MLAADRNAVFAYAVCVDGKAVGSIGAFRQENIHFRTAELGYYLSEECWGMGIMTEAVRQLCEKIFSKTNIIRIFAEPFSHNIGSRKVLEKAGFQLEGILKNYVSKDGKIYDAAMYALTKCPFEIRALARKLPADGDYGKFIAVWRAVLQGGGVCSHKRRADGKRYSVYADDLFCEITTKENAHI